MTELPGPRSLSEWAVYKRIAKKHKTKFGRRSTFHICGRHIKQVSQIMSVPSETLGTSLHLLQR